MGPISSIHYTNPAGVVGGGGIPLGGHGDERRLIREVWASNFEEELNYIRMLVTEFPYIAMDTEFPGVVAKPIGTFKSYGDFTYQQVRCNVDLLKMIQLGITFANEKGESPPDACTWQFNFKFSLETDMYSMDSIELLEKAGIDFKKHEDYGIELEEFGELLISSGLVLVDNVRWVSFHSGYDFGYLLKVVSGNMLPPDEQEFFRLLHIYFPGFYDIKYLMKSCKSLKGGLQELADDLQIRRVGQQHQAGSDSLLTCMAFFKMRATFFEDLIDDNKYLGILYGLGAGAAQYVPGYGAGTLMGAPLTPSGHPSLGESSLFQPGL